MVDHLLIGIEFYKHQRKLEVKLMGLRIAKQDKMEAAQQFNEEVVNRYRSQISKLEKEDLRKEKEELMRKILSCFAILNPISFTSNSF